MQNAQEEEKDGGLEGEERKEGEHEKGVKEVKGQEVQEMGTENEAVGGSVEDKDSREGEKEEHVEKEIKS